MNVSSYTVDNLPETLYLPAYSISPEEIVKGDILFFNVDFFSKPVEIKEEWGAVLDEDGNPMKNEKGEEIQEIKSYYYEDEDGNKITTSPQNMAANLRQTISKWYVALRNIALVMMMIVLLYIGIRMLLSTLSSDKAKYRQMLQDWLIGLVILFFMHYIMSFSVTLVGKLTQVISSSVDENGFAVIIPDDTNNHLTDYIKNTGNQELIKSIVNSNLESDENGDFVFYPTNLLGKMRLELQLSNWGTEYIGYAICFIILVLFTLFFVFTYTKRFLYMAFLTLMAPLVAVTYPIDKVSDGSAQGFNKWLKEYVFNLLIQPMHLLLYYILITSAFDLASKNLVYSIVAIGFMLPAEKLLRTFFGFEKASTPGVFAGAAGGALAMQGINKLGALLKGGDKKGGSGSSANGSSESTDSQTPKMRGDIDEAQITAGKDENKQENNSATQASNNMERESLEEKLADGQITEDELTPEQKQLLGIENNKNEQKKNEEKEDKEGEFIPYRSTQHTQKGMYVSGFGNAGNIKDRVKRKIKSVAKAMKASAKYKLKKLPGAAVRTTVKGIGAGSLAAMGVAAGAATGDPSNAFTYGTTAGAVGLGTTASLINGGSSFSEEYRTARDNVRNSPEFEEINQKDYIKKFKNDEKNKELLLRNFEKNKVKNMLSDGGVVDQCLNNRVNDIENIMTIQKMVDDKDVKDLREAIAYAKYADRVGADYNTDKKAKWKETFANEYQEKVGLNEAEAKKTATKTMDKIAKFNKKKKSIYK